MRRPLLALLVVLAALVPATRADAARTVTVIVRGGTVDVPNWTVTARARPGSRVRALGATRVRRAGRTLTLTRARFRVLDADGRLELRLRVRGGLPGRWRATSPKRDGRCRTRKLRVTCRFGPREPLEPDDGPGDGPYVPFLPYAEVETYPPPELAQLRAAAGLRAMTVGFVLARQDPATQATTCEPTWGGFGDYPAAGDAPYRLDDIRAAGTGRVVSFGGAAGVELARACPTADALLAAYRSVLAVYGATSADFDVEGDATLADTAATARRNQALAALAADGVTISYTLAVSPAGLEPAGLDLLRDGQARGLRPNVVNVMAMDYGDAAAPSPKGRMGEYAIEAGRATLTQLAAIWPDAGPSMLGVTPMIGVNDVPTEVFGLEDARQLRVWALQLGIGRLSMWQLARDRACEQPQPQPQLACSGVDQEPFAFARQLNAPP